KVHTNLEILDRIGQVTGMLPAQLLTPLCQRIPITANQ
ncbi:XRE family transcriptional regulator, partial [Anaerotruncus colihominis]|nr:XRE family transcriptional regulator [Anaerotruncus colihominis]NBI80278.1 XRE family transcriptional regulator [Anaerotruncus colihominis]